MIYETKNLTFSYGKDPLLCDVNLTLSEGELVTVLGRNGAGKSTLFSCITGLLKPQGGEILLEGKNINSLNERQIASVVSFVPQNHVPSFGFSVFDFVLMGTASKVGLFSHPGKDEEASALAALERLGISNFADRSYMELSGGERQQVCIARAIAAKPKVILFDEPTAHLDYTNQIKVLRIIKELASDGYSMAVTTHDPNHAILLDGNVYLFDGNGHVTSGSSNKLITEEKLKSIYGGELKIRYLEEFGRNVCLYPSLD